MYKKYEELEKINIDKKINSVVEYVGDNIAGNWDPVMNNVRRHVCFFLSMIAKKHDLSNIKTILDIGSLNGAESVFFAQLLPNCTVHSFDANPNACKSIKDNQKKYPNLFCHNLAISNIEDNVDFYLTAENIGASSLLKPMLGTGYVGNSCSKIKVKCTTVEKFCKENNISNIDLIWMDLQGNELNALKGIGNLLNNVKGICSEVGLIPYYEGHSLYNEIYNYLKTFGFERDFTPIPFEHNCGAFEDDMIFIK